MLDAQLLGMEEEVISFILVGLVDLVPVSDDFLSTQKAKAASQRPQLAQQLSESAVLLTSAALPGLLDHRAVPLTYPFNSPA